MATSGVEQVCVWTARVERGMWQSGQARVSIGRCVALCGLCVVSVRVARALRCREVVVHDQVAIAPRAELILVDHSRAAVSNCIR